MDWITVGIGVAAILYGLYMAYARRSAPEPLSKLESMKKMWGDTAGYWVHVVGYTVLPIAFGLVVAYAGVKGGSIFQSG